MKAKISKGRGFRGCLNYVAEKEGAMYLGGNMQGETAQELAAEFGDVRAMYHGRGEKPVYHVALSPAPGEVLDDFTAQRVAEDYMERMGLDPNAHQYALYRHTDTDHEHYHLVANRITYEGDYWNDQFDVYRSIQATQEMEAAFDLVRTPGLEGDRRRVKVSKAEQEQAARLGLEQHPKEAMAKRIDAALDASTGTRESFTLECEKRGVSVHWSETRTGKVRGASFGLVQPGQLATTQGEIAETFQGAKIGKAYGWNTLKQRLIDRGLAVEMERGSMATEQKPFVPETPLASFKKQLEQLKKQGPEIGEQQLAKELEQLKRGLGKMGLEGDDARAAFRMVTKELKQLQRGKGIER